MKRYFSILILAYILINPIYAQDCSTPDISEAEYYALPWYDNEDFLTDYYDSLENAMNTPALRTSAPGDIESPWLRIPIKFWVYQNSNTDPGGNVGRFPSDDRIQLIIDKLNNAFKGNGIKFRFYIECVSFVSKASAVRTVGFNEKLSLATSYRNNTAINVHIVDDLDGETNAVGEFNSLYDAIFINRSVGTSDLGAETLPHEVGHYFGLMHTFYGYGVPCLWEPVTRGWTFSLGCLDFNKQCKKTGDLLCDTNADPNMSKRGIYNSSPTCTYNPNGTKDYLNSTYHPNPTNYMAYGNRGCRDQFTQGQANVMYFTAFFRRRALAANWKLKNSDGFDIYEPDNAAIAAREITVGETQRHSFHSAGCNDTEDWLQFNYNGSLSDYQLRLYTISGQNYPVQEVRIFNPVINGMPGARITNITSIVASGVNTITIPCTTMTSGNTYLIQVLRGSNGIGQYEMELLGDETNVILSGPTNVCTTNSTFTVNNLPSGATITWTKSSNLTYVSGQGTASYRVKASSSSVRGNGWVKASVSANCGSGTGQKNFWVGSPSMTGTVNGPDQLTPGLMATYYVDNVTNSSSQSLTYQWIIPTGCYNNYCWNINNGQGSRQISISAGDPGYDAIECRVYNTCGSDSRYKYVTVQQPPGGGGHPCDPYLSVAPNPQKKEKGGGVVINIIYPPIECDPLVRTSIEGSDNTLEIYSSSNGELLYQQHYTTNVMNLDDQQLKKGSYIVIVKHRGKSLRGKLRIN